ncbi:hypothetical protein SDC9_92248 [bioreactor metagenome]|uniref:Uncharacterized protein n=1 Tax=bioreactor metagenome TaxID=1076179 RepID=A0A644ZX53_9ZZZZ
MTCRLLIRTDGNHAGSAGLDAVKQFLACLGLLEGTGMGDTLKEVRKGENLQILGAVVCKGCRHDHGYIKHTALQGLQVHSRLSKLSAGENLQFIPATRLLFQDFTKLHNSLVQGVGDRIVETDLQNGRLYCGTGGGLRLTTCKK